MSKQFGIKEVLNFDITNFSTSAPVFYTDYASSTSVETNAERLDLRGGQGNYKLLAWDHTKNTIFRASLPLVDLNALAMISGSALNTGAVQVPKREVLFASATNKITLTETPVTGTLKVFKLVSDRDYGTEQTVGTPGTTVDTYSISAKEITLNATTAPVGTAFVVKYDYLTGATANQIKILADKFPGFVRITGEGLWRDQVLGTDRPVVFDIKKAKVKPNATLTMGSSDATTLELEFDLYVVTVSNEKMYMTITEIE